MTSLLNHLEATPELVAISLIATILLASVIADFLTTRLRSYQAARARRAEERAALTASWRVTEPPRFRHANKDAS